VVTLLGLELVGVLSLAGGGEWAELTFLTVVSRIAGTPFSLRNL
jgi:hypothetical protein